MIETGSFRPTRVTRLQIMNHPWLLRLGDWIQTSSQVTDIEGVAEQMSLVVEECERLGLLSRCIRNPTHPSADLLLATTDLTLGSREREVDVTLVAHADTVLPYLSSVHDSQNWIHGSGACDNKGGMAVLFAGVEEYLRQSVVPLRLRILISPNEENGSLGFHGLFSELSKKTELVLGFEPSLPSGDFIHSRRGNRWYQITAEGVEAHAGRAGNNARNAANELILFLGEVLKHEKRDCDLHINIGSLSGGRDLFNIVCGHATAKVDVRFGCAQTRDEFHDQFLQHLEKSREKAKLHWQLVDDCPPMPESPQGGDLLKEYAAILGRHEGQPIRSVRGFGASDVNHISRKEGIAMDGLGPTGAGMHTLEEKVYAPSVLNRANALAEFLLFIERGKSL